MQPFETELIRATASNPTHVAHYLFGDRLDVGLDWFPSLIAKKFFSSLASLYLDAKSINLPSIIAGTTGDLGAFTPEEFKEIMVIWKSATQSETVDVSSIVTSIRTNRIIAKSNDAISEYQGKVSKSPSKVVDHIDGMVGKLSILVNEGIDYDPTPSIALNEPTMRRIGSWGNIVLDEMFSEKGKNTNTGGYPEYGMVVASMPTGQGKSCLGITMAAYTLAYEHGNVLIMSNELPRSLYAHPIKNALTHIFSKDATETQIDKLMDERLKIYAPTTSKTEKGYPVTKFEQMQRLVSNRLWRPRLAIMDSITNISAPIEYKNLVSNDLHEAKANAIRNTCLDTGVVMYCPGNMSEKNMSILSGKKPDDLQHVMLFQSITYEMVSDFSFLGYRDRVTPFLVHMRRTKNRHGSSLGELWDMMYVEQGQYYVAQ